VQFSYLAVDAIALAASASVAAKTKFRAAPATSPASAVEHATQGAN
jgi:hypothetical protein